MFFYIGENKPFNSLVSVTPRLHLDQGWNEHNGSWYKGYSTECRLNEAVDHIVGGYQPAGKWCVICDEKIYHPPLRGFPVFEKNGDLTNIKLDGYDVVTYVNPDPVPGTLIDMGEASEIIGDILVENTRNLYQFNDVGTVTQLFSAGLDTLTTWAAIDQCNVDYTVSVHVPIETDLTTEKYMGTTKVYTTDLMEHARKTHWGYQSAIFNLETNWNITGYYAEVIQYRDGVAINALANNQGKRIDELANEDDYLYWFLKRPNIVEQYRDSKLTFASEDELKHYLYMTVFYDCQMWHLDNNLEFSPFFDLRIPNVMSRLSIEDITRNSVTGDIQKRIVSRFKPEILPLLSDYKNSKDIWTNYRANIHALPQCDKDRIQYR